MRKMHRLMNMDTGTGKGGEGPPAQGVGWRRGERVAGALVERDPGEEQWDQ
jgi:hypothetical protein